MCLIPLNLGITGVANRFKQTLFQRNTRRLNKHKFRIQIKRSNYLIFKNLFFNLTSLTKHIFSLARQNHSHLCNKADAT